jgi:hypothetical protein
LQLKSAKGANMATSSSRSLSAMLGMRSCRSSVASLLPSMTPSERRTAALLNVHVSVPRVGSCAGQPALRAEGMACCDDDDDDGGAS